MMGESKQFADGKIGGWRQKAIRMSGDFRISLGRGSRARSQDG
jgi:hypothetical protein